MNLILFSLLLVFFDIFFGIPLLLGLWYFGADFLILLILGSVMVLAPLFVLLIEMRERAKYPIRAFVSYQTGSDSVHAKTYGVEDRLGYVDIRTKKDEATGAKEWRLRNLKRPVQNFNYNYVYEQAIFFGLRRAPVAHVIAVNGLNGEEFRPIKYDASLGSYKPVFDGDRGLLYYKITKAIEDRNKIENWWRQNLIPLLGSALELVIAIMLFLCFMQLTEVSKALHAAASASAQCHESNLALMNKTTSETTIKPGNVAGIPFGVGGG